MAITLNALDFLVSARGQALLARLETEDLAEAHTLSLLTTLRRDAEREHAAAALTLARLRRRAVEKFGSDSSRMYFTDAALQQASHPLVRAYRAASVGSVSVLIDACCGVGSDTLAYAAAGTTQAVGYDIDPLCIAMARLNAEACGLTNTHFETKDVRQLSADSAEVIFFDPARRDEDRRLKSVEAYIPPLSTMNQWPAGRIVVKLAPGVDLRELHPYPGRIEFISVHGELKEAVLWTGETSIRQATLLSTEEGSLIWRRDSVPELPSPAPPRAWLVEPDPALIRAGLVQDAAAMFNGILLDETIAYFTTDERPLSPWVRAWQILDWMPFHLKKLRAALRADNVGRLTIKKRGSPLTPEGLTAQLKLKGSESRTLVLTRHAGQFIVLICADYTVQ